MHKSVALLEKMGRRGLIVSVVYGRRQNGQLCYSVGVRNKNGDVLVMRCTAETFEQAIGLAACEAAKRDWITL